MIHKYNINENKFKLLKHIILAVCLLISLINIVFMISSIVVKIWFNLIYVAVIWIVLLLIRIASTYLTYNFEYTFNLHELKIIKKYPMSENKPIIFKIDEIKSICEYDNNFQGDIISLCSKSCALKKYVIKYQNSAYLIALDEYGYCILNRSINDLFR